MTYKELKQRATDIDLIEKDFMRDLTEEEKDLIAEKGFKAFLDKVEINISDLALIKRVREIFGTFFSGSIEEYENLVNKNDNKRVIETLEDILKDLTKKDKKQSNCGETDAIEYYINKLKSGETLELDSDVLDQVIDRLWSKETNIKIEVRNNKIRLR